MKTRSKAFVLLGLITLTLPVGFIGLTTPPPVGPAVQLPFFVEITNVTSREKQEGFLVESPSSLKVLISDSSSCPAGIEKVVMEKDVIVIHHVTHPTFMACNEDSTLTAYRVTTTDSTFNFADHNIVIDRTGSRYELQNFTPRG